MDKTETKEMQGVEPILIQAGDKRVLLNGFPPILPIRVVAEAKYQEIISELQKAKELNREIVNRSAQQLKEYREVIRELLPYVNNRISVDLPDWERKLESLM